MVDPETGFLLFIVGGIGTVATFTAFKAAEKIGPKVGPNDLLPMPPPYPPLPRFLFTKPEVVAEMRRRR